MAKYNLPLETRDKIKGFLSPFMEIMNTLEKEEMDESETNQILALLGRYPAFEVYELIDLIRSTVTFKESEDGE